MQVGTIIIKEIGMETVQIEMETIIGIGTSTTKEVSTQEEVVFQDKIQGEGNGIETRIIGV